MRRRLRDRAAIIVHAPAHHRPAVVAACLGNVQLVPAPWAKLGLPQLSGLWVDGGALRVTVAKGPDLGHCVLLLDEGIVTGDSAVGIDAHDLAQVVAEVLRGLEREPLAERDEQLPVSREHKPRPEMIPAGDLWKLPEDYLDIVDAAVTRLAAGNGGSGVIFPWLRIG